MKKTLLTCALSLLLTVSPVLAQATVKKHWPGFTRNRTVQTSNGGNYQKRATVTPTGNGSYTRTGTFNNTFPNGRNHSGTFQGTGQLTRTGNSVTNDYTGTRTYQDGQTVDVTRDSTVTKTGNGFDKTTTTTVTAPDGKPLTTVNSDTTHVNGQGNATDTTVTGPAGHTETIDSNSSRTGPGTFDQQATVKNSNGQVIGGDTATGTVQVQNGNVVRTVQGTTDNGTRFNGASDTSVNSSGVTTTSSGAMTGPAGHTTTFNGTSRITPQQWQSMNLSRVQKRQIFQILGSTSDPAERQARIRAILTPDQITRWQQMHSQN